MNPGLRATLAAGNIDPLPVPRGSERLRFTPGPHHDKTMMLAPRDALVEIWDRLEMKLAA